MVETTVVIISFNTRAQTLECLRSLVRTTRGMDLDVVVVDNASSDGSADAIAAEFPGIRLIRLDENTGFARANNLAVSQSAGRWVLLLNPDTVVIEGAIQGLLKFAEAHPEASIFGGRTFFGDGTLNPKSCWRRPTPWSVFCAAAGLTGLFPKSQWFARESYGPWKRDTARCVDIVSGCLFLIRREAWDRLGGFDPRFFMYGEEADLCLRAARMGYRCMTCPDAKIIHYGGASEKVRADKMVRLFEGKARLFARHWGRASLRLGIAGLDLWAWARMVGFGVMRLAGARYAEGYETWKSVWRRREAWREAADELIGKEKGLRPLPTGKGEVAPTPSSAHATKPDGPGCADEDVGVTLTLAAQKERGMA